MESPSRMSLDDAPPRTSFDLHALCSSSSLASAPRQASFTNSGLAATLSFRGASAAVTLEEAEALLSYLERENVNTRAGFTLRKAAGCVLRLPRPLEHARLAAQRLRATPHGPRPVLSARHCAAERLCAALATRAPRWALFFRWRR